MNSIANLESFKGRQRLKGIHMDSAFQPVIVVPRARSWSFAANSYEADQTTSLDNPINQGSSFAAGNGKCPPGPPGVPGLPGLDGGWLFNS